MNHRLLALVVLGVSLGMGGASFGQSMAPAVRSATTLSDKENGAIAEFVKAQIAKLTSDDPSAQSAGRDALVEAAGGEASAPYLDRYAQVLNEAILTVADNPSMRARLDAAIVTARVAEKANNIRLKPAALKFLTDKSDPVVLWGVKAAKALIPVQLRLQADGNDPLIHNLVPAIQDNLAGPVTQEAYEALRLNISDMNVRKGLNDAMIKAVIPEMQRLLAARVAKYAEGMPENPQVETLATNFLVDQMVWNLQTPQQRVQSVQLILGFLTDSVKRLGSLNTNDKSDVVQAIRLVSSGVRVVGELVKNQDLVTAATPLTKIDISIDPKVMMKYVDDLATVAANSPAMKGLQRPNTQPAK